jgi:hypothetical protein
MVNGGRPLTFARLCLARPGRRWPKIMIDLLRGGGGYHSQCDLEMPHNDLSEPRDSLLFL